jgi:hypothetical protein
MIKIFIIFPIKMSSRPTCQRNTKAGNSCKKYAQGDTNYCHLHQNESIETKNPIVSYQRCIAQTQKGTKCQIDAQKGTKFCFHHQPDKKEDQELYNDVENIVAEYLEPVDYQKLIEYDPLLYNWDRYYKHKTLPTLHEAISMDIISLTDYLLNIKNHINYTDENLNVKSIDMLKYLNKKQYEGLSEYNYEGIINNALLEGNYKIIDYIIRYKKYDFKEYNSFGIEGEIIKSDDPKKFKYFIDFMKRRYKDNKGINFHMGIFIENYDYYIKKNKNPEVRKYMEELNKEYNS